ncbi:hypothetical protein [Sphingomonas sp.]|uniref:hypothetical protein n=1 Tax=Sphingomonas sp. TaxID=28214 RepID=UPI002E12CD00|nr:hypothetical protein [Sphingomonas sp.]
MLDVFGNAKGWLVEWSGLARDSLHVHIGLLVFFAAALIFRWPLRSWKPWAVALAITLAGEAWDICDTLAAGRRVRLDHNWQDIWNTMLWPTAILILARTTRVFGTKSRTP